MTTPLNRYILSIALSIFSLSIVAADDWKPLMTASLSTDGNSLVERLNTLSKKAKLSAAAYRYAEFVSDDGKELY